jgi:hypothetical protein
VSLEERSLRSFAGVIASYVAVAALVSCGGAPPSVSDARYPPRPEGCDVKVFHDAPSMATHNIGPVNARCGSDVSEVDCLRTLQDQVCKLGGDIVWGVPDKPETVGDKNVWNARAAHTREPAPATP